jgi:hypothetical protein
MYIPQNSNKNWFWEKRRSDIIFPTSVYDWGLVVIDGFLGIF